MTYSLCSRSKSRNSFVALLLQPTLRNFGALAPVNHLGGITYRSNYEKSRKSFIALLLPHLFPVSPLLRYSYKKMGGVPHPVGKDETSNTGFSLSAVSQNGTHIVKLACRPPAGQAGLGRPVSLKPITYSVELPRGFNTPDPVDIVDTNLQCFLSLTDFPRACPRKTPNVFYNLRAMFHLSTSVFYHLQKRGRGVARSLRPDAFGREGEAGKSPRRKLLAGISLDCETPRDGEIEDRWTKAVYAASNDAGIRAREAR